MRQRMANSLRFVICGLMGLLLFSVPGVRGQFKLQVEPGAGLIPAEEGSDPSLVPRADISKDLSKAMAKAEEYRDRKEYDNAVEIVQRYILDQKDDDAGRRAIDRSADYFVDQKMDISLKRQALRLIGDLPEEGRRIYELKYGESARAMLADAVSANDTKQLENIARQYFHTKAGYEATYLMGTHKLDQGETLAAAMHFEQLRELPEASRIWEPALSLKSAVAWFRSGEIDRAVEIATELKKLAPNGRLSLGARTIPLFVSDREAEGWLAQLVGQPLMATGSGAREWTMFRGNPSRNVSSAPSSPAGEVAWEFTTIRDPDALLEDPKRLEAVNAQLREMEEDRRNSGFLTLPAAHPLIIGDSVVFRTMRNIRAVHLKTGELLWETAMISPSYEKLVATDSPEANIRQGNPTTTALERLLSQRAWRDLTAGTLSSDGRYVFALDAMGFLSTNQRNIRGLRTSLSRSDSSKLVAYDLQADGKLVWEVGGSRDYGLEMAGTFFLGPPLPLDGHLYCIAEVTGDVRLVVLNARTGRHEWSQTLVLPEATLQQFPVRRIAGLSPTYSDGVLVCPTTSGAVVAVDPGRRVLMWGKRYSRSTKGVPTDPRQLMILRARGMSLMSGLDDEDRWIDAAPTIADGRILLTPRDSDELHCLNLVDGSVVWKKSRGSYLYLATVYEGKVVLVGRSQMQAFSLETGEPVWSESISIETPSGRGIRDGRFYRIPLSTGDIASVDLKVGKVVGRSKAGRGDAPGNLAAAHGTIVAQSIDKIIGFHSLDELQRRTDAILAKNPNDADALALRGEMLLHNGDEEQGLANLRKANEIKPIPRARALVVSILLEGLRHDFRKYSPLTDEIERLIDDPQQRGRYLRLNAAGLHKMGDQQGAFREYLKIASADTGKPELERVTATLSVRSDRWIRPRISEVYRKSSGDERAELDRAIATLLETATEKPDETKRLYRFLDAFLDLPMGEQALQLLANRLSGEEQPLEQELLLRRLLRSSDRSRAGFATAKLAALYIENRRASPAAAMLDELATEWNDVVCIDDKTGRQLVEEWRAADEVAKLLEEQADWPETKINAKKAGRRGAVVRNYPVQIQGPRGPLGEGWTLVLDQRRQNLIARDEDGNEMWKLATAGFKTMIPNVYGNYARVNGHLLIVVFGNHFVVLDALQTQQDSSAPRILWQARLVEGSDANNRNVGVQFRQVMGPGGVRIMTVQDRYGRPLGKVVPIYDSLICYQVGTKLVAADPLTGETLWERRSVTRGSEIFGDREFVFVVPPNSKEALTLRAADGEQVATRPLPTEGTRLSTLGRFAMVWTGRALQKYDVWTGKNEWEKRMPPGAKVIALDSMEDAVAVLNPNQGSFAIVSADDGRLLVDSGIEADGSIDSFVVQRSRDQYILMTHTPPKAANGAQVVALNYNNPLVNGFVYGFDRKSGKKIWGTYVANQAFDVDQPAGLPILVFTARTYRPFQGGRAINRNQYSVAVIDKRNGRNIYSESSGTSLSQFEVTADVKSQKIAVQFYNATLDLSVTKEPLADPVQGKRPLDEK